MSSSRPITPHGRASPLICSEFREGRNYTNWRPRGSGDWLVIFTVAGAGRVGFGARSHTTQPGELVLFAPGAAQDYSTDLKASLWHLRWAHFEPKPHWKGWLLWPEIGPGVGSLRLGDATAVPVARALERMLVAYRRGGTAAIDLAMNALEEMLIWAYRGTVDERFGRIDARMQKAAQYLATHPSEPFRLEVLARYCALSPSRLSHLFKRELNTTPQRFSEKIRLEYAQHLLEQTNLTINQIASEVGFSDPLYFSRRFRVLYGQTPTSFRLAAHARPERRRPRST
jgi:AraC family transcriptional regulator of arabinose operon